MTAFNLSDFLPYKLSILSETVSQHIAGAYESRFGLTMNQWRCMVLIGAHGPITAKSICAKTLLDKMTVSRALKSLKTRKLIAAASTPEDARKNLLTLTKHGIRIHDEVLPMAQNYEEILLAALSDSQKITLDEIIKKLMHEAREINTRDREITTT